MPQVPYRNENHQLHYGTGNQADPGTFKPMAEKIRQFKPSDLLNLIQPRLSEKTSMASHLMTVGQDQTMTCLWMKFTLINLPFISGVKQLSRRTRLLLPFQSQFDEN
jgi:hypothetical protein